MRNKPPQPELCLHSRHLSLTDIYLAFVSKVEARRTSAASERGETRILNTRYPQVPIQEPVVPREASIEKLMSMGFDRAVASGALIQSRNNLQIAIDSLFYDPTASRSNE